MYSGACSRATPIPSPHRRSPCRVGESASAAAGRRWELRAWGPRCSDPITRATAFKEILRVLTTTGPLLRAHITTPLAIPYEALTAPLAAFGDAAHVNRDRGAGSDPRAALLRLPLTTRRFDGVAMLLGAVSLPPLRLISNAPRRRSCLFVNVARTSRRAVCPCGRLHESSDADGRADQDIATRPVGGRVCGRRDCSRPPSTFARASCGVRHPDFRAASRSVSRRPPGGLELSTSASTLETRHVRTLPPTSGPRWWPPRSRAGPSATEPSSSTRLHGLEPPRQRASA